MQWQFQRCITGKIVASLEINRTSVSLPPRPRTITEDQKHPKDQKELKPIRRGRVLQNSVIQV